MSSSSDSIVPIEKLKLGILPNHFLIKDGSGTPAKSVPEKARSSAPSFDALDPAQDFRDTLVRVLSSRFSRRLNIFMAKADEYPRFVWENFLLSFHSYLTNSQQPETNFGMYGLKKFSHIIDAYPDVLQRELLRDSFQLANERNDRYGVLHAAALCDRRDLVKLVRDPDAFRMKIFELLTPTESDEGFDSFNLIRRAVLWRHMHRVSAQYAKVATFMKKFNKAKKPEQIESLRKLIDNTAEQIDSSDGEFKPDPWVVVLAWASTSPSRSHIIAEFKIRKPEVFKKIRENLEKRESLFACFFAIAQEERVKSNLDREEQRKMVESIVKVLVLNCSTGPAYEACMTLMRRFFLDRLSVRTPGFRWSPLHLAAARGNHAMIQLLTESCDAILDKLEAGEEKETYIKNLQASFFDAKYMTPLHHAVSGNHKDVVQCLMQWEVFQPFVNQIDIFMRTPFQMACNLDRLSILEQLIKDQVDVNTKDCCSFTSLHWAVHSGYPEIVKFLLSFEGSERKLRTTVKDVEGQNAYDLAFRKSLVLQRCNSDDKARQDEAEYSLKVMQLDLLGSPAVREEVEALYRDRQVYADASNAILVCATLIASVTFGGWLQPPLGNDDGLPSYAEVSLFWTFSSLSFFFSMATVLSGAAAVLPVGGEYIRDSVERIRRWLVVTSFLLILSVAFVLGAFAAAGFSALSPLPQLRNNMTITTSCGVLVCTIIGLRFCLRMWKVRPDWLGRGRLNPMFKEAVRKWLGREDVWMKLLRSLSVMQGEFSHERSRRENTLAHSVKSNEKSVTVGPKDSMIWKFIPTITEVLRLRESESESLVGVPKDAPPSIGLDREFLGGLWKSKHSQDRSKRCPLRESHKQLDSRCSREILEFSIDEEGSLKGYVLMWRQLSRGPPEGATFFSELEKLNSKVEDRSTAGEL